MSPCRCTRCRWKRRTASACSRPTTTTASSSSTRSRTTRSSNLISMGIYVFNKQTLIEQLVADAQRRHRRTTSAATSSRRWSRTRRCASTAIRFNGYWRDVGTIESYYDGNMDLLEDLPELNMYDPDSRIRSRVTGLPAGEDRPPRVHLALAARPGLHHQRPCRALGALARRVRRRRRGRARLDHLRRLPHRSRARSSSGRSSTRTCWSARTRTSATATTGRRTTSARTSSTAASRSSASARRCRRTCGSAATASSDRTSTAEASGEDGYIPSGTTIRVDRRSIFPYTV